jgi:hypothetical protein
MLDLPVYRVVDKKRIFGKNGWTKRRRKIKGPLTKKCLKTNPFLSSPTVKKYLKV